MTRCEHFQALMLEHLYGLLEPEESQELTQHLEGCGGCREALVRAGQEQGMLAKAARREFPAVQFVPPAEAPVAGSVPAARVASGSPSWFRWSVAAAILLGVLGLGIPSGLYSQQRDRVDSARAKLEEARKKSDNLNEEYRKLKGSRDQAQKEIDDVRKEMDNLAAQRNQAVQKVFTEVNSQHFRMAVSGPKSPIPGAPNAYTIETRSINYQPAAANVTVQVRDASTNNLVYEVKDAKSTGRLKFELPSDLPLKPNVDLVLEVSALAGDKVEHLADVLKLVAPVYLTHLTTDKPMYQIGETVRFRSLTLERFSLTPAQEDLNLVYTVTKPDGSQVAVANGLSQPTNENGIPFIGPDKKPIRGIGGGEYVLSEPLGGEYSVSVKDAQNRFPEQKRKFIVNKYERDRLDKIVKFTRSSYGPGDKVSVTITVNRAGGGPLANQPVVEAVLNVDGTKIGPVNPSPRTDNAGTVEIQFKELPKNIVKGNASVSVSFTDGGSVEPVVRPVPLVLSKLEVEFFPEGGDLVLGLPNRVYFEARNTLGKPAELKGRLLDENNVVACDVQTFSDPKQPDANHGMGAFTFTPVAGKKYRLQVDVPAGITELVGPKDKKDGQFLPPVKGDGLVLSVPEGVSTGKEPIHVMVRSGKVDRRVLVGAYCRGRLMAHQRVEVKAGKTTEVDLRPEGSEGGVYRVTVFEEQPAGNGKIDLVPAAERLVYRAPERRLNLSVQADKKHYVPGDRVKLVCLSADEKGQKAPAILLVAVVDKSVLAMADEKTFRQMPTHFLLTTEVRRPEDLEHADFLVGSDRQAPVALDLLLGTQGWRRFAEQNPGQFRQQHPQDADQVLVLNNQVTIDNNALAMTKAQKVAETYNAKLTAKEETFQATEAKLVKLYQDDHLVRQRRALEDEADSYKASYDQSWTAFTAFRTRFDKVKQVALPVLALSLLIVGLFALARGLLQQSRAQAIPYLVGGVACLGLCAASVTVPLSPGDTPMVAKALALDVPAWSGDAEAAQLAVDEMANDPANPDNFNVDRAEAEGVMMEKAAGMPGGFGGGKGKGEGKGDDKGRGRARGDFGARPKADLDAQMKRNQGAFDDKKPGNHPVPGMNRAPRMFKPGDAPMAPMPIAPAMAPRPVMMMDGVKKAKDGKMDEAQKEVRRGALRDQPWERAKQPVAGRRELGLAGLAGPQKEPMAAMPMDRRGFRMQQQQQLRKQAEQANGMMAVASAPLVVREFAHHHERASSSVRDDFNTETVYWHPVLVLPDGKAEVSFQLSDSVTTFQVLATGHTLDGRLGAVTSLLESRLPLYVEPKLPTEVTAGDKIDVPVSVANNTDAIVPVKVGIQPKGLSLTQGKATETVTVPADSRRRQVWRLQPTVVEGEASIEVSGSAKGLETDTKTAAFKVVPAGFPITNAASDLLEKVAVNDVAIPKDVLPGTLKFQVAVYPSTLADLQKGLEAMLREPGGCFEQTLTSNYPNLLVLNYLKETDQAKDKPQVVARAKDMLARGYAKLTSFECLDVPVNQRHGYEWFGGTAPAHEALTAYGLMQFRDMAAVQDVDGKMLERTRAYLMSRKDNKGGFLRNPRALDTFGRAPDHVTNAYIVWALTESGKDDDVTKELDAAFDKAKTSKDPYFVSLVAASLLNRNRARDGVDLLTAMAKLQKEDGHLDAEQTSITGSGGRDLQIETTSLALLAWMKAQRPDLFTTNVQKAVKWVGQQRGGYGGFGSTQATILALKSLIAYAKANKKAPEPIDLTVTVGDKVFTKSFPAGTADALIVEVPDAEKFFKAGKNVVRLTSSGKNNYPYTLTWSYRALTPVSAEKCSVRLNASLAHTDLKEGETVRLNAVVENVSGKGQGMALAVLGLPAGLTIPADMAQLKDMAKLRNDGTQRGTIDFFEVRGRELVLYWRDLAPGKKIEVGIDLIARVPGEYKGPASRAYLYYNADHKHWVEPLKVTIAAKAE